MKNRTRNRLIVGLSCFTTLLYACSGGDTGEVGPNTLSGGSTSTGGTGGAIGVTGGVSAVTGGTGGATGGTGGANGGTGNIITTVGGSAGMAPVDPDASCGKGTASANLKPVNMLVMFDRSTSMNECIDGSNPDDGPCPTGSRWDSASAALNAFFASPDAADLGVALRFFPHDLPAVGCSNGNGNNGNNGGCDVNACAQVLVDMGTLTADAAPTDVHEGALIAAVGASGPTESQGTPISAALDGALTWAAAYQAANPEQRTVVVLVTDGQPTACMQDFDDIDQIAADALAASGVTTYAIGLTNMSGGGVSQNDLNGLAEAGGTDQAFFVSDSATAATELTATLNAIRGMAIACDFPLPSSTTSGMAIDPKLINVNYTPTGGTEVQLGLVPSAADCGTEQAWYYDDPVNPTRILLCPSACSTVTADTGASISILAGCVPRIVDPA
jgi:hypothetical protein